MTRLKNAAARFVKYRYAVIAASLAVMTLFIVLSANNKESIAMVAKTPSFPDTSEYMKEPDAAAANGIVPLEYFQFTNTRYIKVTPGGTYKIEIDRDPKNSNESLIWTSSDPKVAEIAQDGTVTAHTTGESMITVCDFSGRLRRRALVEVMENPAAIIDAPYISQLAGYPNGCESVSAVMALNYAGIDITVDDFIEKYLDMKPVPMTDADGELWGYSPWYYFLGDPRDDTGLCCYAPAIKNAMEKIVDEDSYEVLEMYGVPLESLSEEYLNEYIPVIIWGTMYMNEPTKIDWEWNVIDGDEGETFEWIAPIHCLLLIGFDDENYYFNDPIAGKSVAYSKSDVEEAYSGLYSQAIVIRRK